MLRSEKRKHLIILKIMLEEKDAKVDIEIYIQNNAFAGSIK